MTATNIFSIAFILSSVLMAGLVARHWKELWVPLAELDPEHRAFQVKYALTIEQLRRSWKRWTTVVRALAKPLWRAVSAMVKRWVGNLRELEHHYQSMVRIAMLSGPQRLEVIACMLSEAQHAQEAGDWEAAEQKYIDIISIEKTNRRAYEELGAIYYQSGQWKEALETYRFLSRLLQDETPVTVYQRWAQAALELKRPAQAIEALKRAVELEPNNPRTLDLYCESAILGERLALAVQALEQLKSANSENKKIEQFEQRITALRQVMVSREGK